MIPKKAQKMKNPTVTLDCSLLFLFRQMRRLLKATCEPRHQAKAKAGEESRHTKMTRKARKKTSMKRVLMMRRI